MKPDQSLPVGRARSQLVRVPTWNGGRHPSSFRGHVHPEYTAAHGEAERALSLVLSAVHADVPGDASEDHEGLGILGFSTELACTWHVPRRRHSARTADRGLVHLVHRSGRIAVANGRIFPFKSPDPRPFPSAWVRLRPFATPLAEGSIPGASTQPTVITTRFGTGALVHRTRRRIVPGAVGVGSLFTVGGAMVGAGVSVLDAFPEREAAIANDKA